MAKEMITKLTDDLDGSEAVEELIFSLRGAQYEIDLNAKNVAALEKALDRYVKAARKVTHRAPRGSVRRPASRGDSSRGDLSAIREWARSNGFTVSDRGRISAEVRAKYDAAH